jgi:hypothetical protein
MKKSVLVFILLLLVQNLKAQTMTNIEVDSLTSSYVEQIEPIFERVYLSEVEPTKTIQGFYFRKTGKRA